MLWLRVPLMHAGYIEFCNIFNDLWQGKAPWRIGGMIWPQLREKVPLWADECGYQATICGPIGAKNQSKSSLCPDEFLPIFQVVILTVF